MNKKLADRSIDYYSKYDTRILAMEAIRASEEAAIACYDWIGKGEHNDADGAAVDALREALNRMPFNGKIVIGEGERDHAPMLYIGEKVGLGIGPKIDIAVDPLEGTDLCAKALPNALAVIAFSTEGGLLHAPDVYMQKLACGINLPKDVLSLTASPSENIKALAKFKKCHPRDLSVCLLERDRHNDLIEDLRSCDTRVILIPDGDIFAIISTTDPNMHIDMYLGIGGAPEGVLAAAALRCTGGFMQGKLLFKDDSEKDRADKCGITEYDKIYQLKDLAHHDVIFAASGVTDGAFLKGVKKLNDGYRTHSLVMRSKTGTTRFTDSFHNLRNKAWLKVRTTI